MKKKLFSHATLVCLLALLATCALTLLISPETEAVGCDENNHSLVNVSWLLTEAAQARTALGVDCPNSVRPVCREECIVSCGDIHPQDTFACFAN